MADVSRLSELIRQQAFLEAGGGEESALDKTNKILGTVSNLANLGINIRKSKYDIKKMQDDIINNELARKAKQVEIDKAKREITPESALGIPSPAVAGIEQPGLTAGMTAPLTSRPPLGGFTVEENLKRAQTQKALREEQIRPQKQGIHRIIDRKTGKIVSTYPATEGSGDTFTLVGEGGAAGTGKPLPASQADAFLGTITALQQLENMERLARTGKLSLGPTQVRYTDIPGTGRFIAAAGTPEDREFKKALRDYQAAYLTASTGAQRGMKEVQFLLPATPDPNLLPEKFIQDIQTSKQKAKQQLELYRNYGKTRGIDFSEFETQYPEYFSMQEEIQPGQPMSETQLDPDVVAYAQKHKITNEQAQQIKKTRTGQ